METFNETVKKLLNGEVEIETEHNINFKNDELELCTGGRDGLSAWNLMYRTKKLNDPVYKVDTMADKSSSISSGLSS